MNKALDSEEFKHHLEALDREHDIGRRRGVEARKGWKEYEYVKLEVQYSANWHAAQVLAGLVYEWMTKRNPHYLDLAMAYCHQHEIPPTPTLWRLMGELAEMRVNGEELAGTPAKILKEKAKGATLTLMANLIYHGDTLEVAASKAASQHAKRYPDSKMHYKASSLSRFYEKEWRQSGLEAEHFAQWDKSMPEDWKDAWRRIREILPEADPAMKGNRRE